MKFLIVKDYPTRARDDKMIESFSNNIERTLPGSSIDVCNAVDGEDVPVFSDYDVVILTGGAFDLINNAPAPWVGQVLDRIRDLSKGRSSTKLLGFCWGHQVIHFALGGSLGVLPEGPRIGIEEITLTSPGQDLFGRKSLALHKYHKRVVTSQAPEFSELAHSNEIFVSNSQKIITFQSHPEMTGAISQGLLDSDDGTYKRKANVQSGVELKGIHEPHDGEAVWDRLAQWISVK